MTPRNICDVIDAMLALIPPDDAPVSGLRAVLENWREESTRTAPEAMAFIWQDVGADLRYHIDRCVHADWHRAVCDVFVGKVTP